ncbi:MAG: ABC transporter permease [Isosphaeraceae bacterium]
MSAKADFPELSPVLIPVEPAVKLARGFSPGAWLTLLGLSVRMLSRGRRLLALAALFAAPALLGFVIRYNDPNFRTRLDKIEEVLIFYMIPQALVPLTALILASGMIRDEVEGQTLTYLLIRPIPRPSIYLAKLAAAWGVSAALAAVFVTAALVVLHWGGPELWGEVVPGRAARLVGLSGLSLMVYVALFGILGLVSRWVLTLGVAYTVLFEGILANIDFAFRRVTVLYYVRILAERWFDVHVDSWSIRLEEAPSGTEALAYLAGAALVLSLAGAFAFGSSEIRVKTPEGA